MRETRSSGSVRGASGDGRPYRERAPLIPARPRERRLTEPTTAVQPWWREPLFVPPHPPFAMCVGIGSVGWIPDLRRDLLGRQGSSDRVIPVEPT